ncbi:TetR/AcrR family transcriptional regulator [Sphingomonas profundi]|uniref:TetR/AcrR family transcriptional regulator n=1 Tax=Alterirhizorhabdus profundi TaxID=2681549 RepID=UPI0012E98E8E|nr:TetR/AcrR family transcriptional regulator [Sphingomonas profundi]
MGRRSDHSRADLEALIVAEAHRHMAEVGFARFSAREVAKRIGYSVGTLYNVFGSLNRLLLAVNARTLTLWTEAIEAALAAAPDDRLATLVASYFAFAEAHPQSWSAIYAHRSPPGETLPEWYARALARLLGLVDGEVAAALPPHRRGEAARLARSLLATVHGHCTFAIDGTFALLGERDPMDAVLARIREAIAGPAAS